ncbi:hypothetical protein PRIPAC_85195 [Pristionchus pacificus]|uniref:Uncharacterized protein n=1 Tax=Pristionchus pacificus TaxID=54126 RepID=A0A2A6BUS8_PRIPA|nr:hypothetical protein PRIPAC_85195 [Pristionchus pacificus]|eukprot:PDM69576.1 hypothetical protein PRIPAC_44672 [Pristionchus pacificus]
MHVCANLCILLKNVVYTVYYLHKSSYLFRIGCFPYIKYHCTARPVEDLSKEDFFWRAITVANLGIPCILYGIAATCLISETEKVKVEQREIPIYFLIKENW